MSKKIKIFIAYSQELMATLLRMILEKHGFHIVTAQIGNEANEKLRTCPVDIMLLDIEQPDSKVAIANMRHYSDVPIIVVSTQSKKSVINQALQAGASAYIVKPFPTELLLTEIEKVLSKEEFCGDALDVPATKCLLPKSSIAQGDGWRIVTPSLLWRNVYPSVA